MTEGKFRHWITVGEGALIVFGDLPHLMAKALHPSDRELTAYSATRINLEEELRNAVQASRLVVRNASGLGLHTSPYGEALQRAVMMPSDVEPFLSEHGIGLLVKKAAFPAEEMEGFVGWYDATLDASHWLNLASIKPQEAAMLLCEFNPRDANVSPEVTTNSDTNPEDYKRLLRKFEDVAVTNPLTRSLPVWVAVAKEAGLKYHPWVDKYLKLAVNQPRTPNLVSGTPSKLSEVDKAEIVQRYNRGRGESVYALAKSYSVARPTIDKVLRNAGIKK